MPGLYLGLHKTGIPRFTLENNTLSLENDVSKNRDMTLPKDRDRAGHDSTPHDMTQQNVISQSEDRNVIFRNRASEVIFQN